MLDRKALLKKVRKWVQEGKKVDGEDQPLTYLQLIHQNEGSGSPVDGWDIKADGPGLEELTREMAETAEGDASGHGEGVQQYYFAAYFGNASPESLGYGARYPFRIYRAPDVNEANQEITGSESATPRGMLQGNQRHLERMVQLFAGPIEANNRSLQRQVEQLTDEVGVWRDKYMGIIDWYEQARAAQREDEDAKRRYAYWEQKKEQIAGIIMPLLPAIIGALLKRKNEGPSPELIAVKEWFKTIQGPQWDALVLGNPEKGVEPILTPGQQLFFQAAMKQFMEMEDADEAAVRARMGEGETKKKEDE